MKMTPEALQGEIGGRVLSITEGNLSRHIATKVILQLYLNLLDNFVCHFKEMFGFSSLIYET